MLPTNKLTDQANAIHNSLSYAAEQGIGLSGLTPSFVTSAVQQPNAVTTSANTVATRHRLGSGGGHYTYYTHSNIAQREILLCSVAEQ